MTEEKVAIQFIGRLLSQRDEAQHAFTGLLTCALRDIISGDWKIDGANDPDPYIYWAFKNLPNKSDRLKDLMTEYFTGGPANGNS